MEPLVVVGIVIVALLGIITFLLWRRGVAKTDSETDGMVLIQNQIQELARTVDSKIGESSRQMNEHAHRQFAESSRLIKEITEEITSVKEIGRQTQGFAEQLKTLQDILKNPKQRGVLGEYYLETVLQNVLPPDSFRMQYPFSNGDIVDAAVFVKEKIIPIDSKFSLENYNRMIHAEGGERAAIEKAFVNDLKLRIQETAKYIRTAEGTTDFAFMFIPSEGIYYDLITNTVGADEDSLIQRAAGRYKVIIVSPTSFLAYLQTVLQGLKAMEIEEKAHDIIKNVSKLSSHIERYEEYYKKLGASLSTTVNHYNAGYKELGKIDKDVLRITGESSGMEPSALDRPAENP